jgi:uroporphyrinogen decarboxylase
MHPRVEKLPRPEPDFREFLRAVRRERTRRVPLIELAVAAEVTAALLDEPAHGGDGPAPASVLVERQVRLLHRLGYDVIKVSAGIPFRAPRLSAREADSRKWQDQHAALISTPADHEGFPWPGPDDIDFGPLEAARQALPDGMAMVGFSGGVLEFATDLMGLEPFLYATYDQPELVEAVIDAVGRTILSVFECYCTMEHVCALWLGDDLGSKNGLLLSPDWIVQMLVPWYRRFADLAHQHRRPFLLHSCGKVVAAMPSLIDAGIDAKHSFEDGIEPVERFIDAWGDRVAVLGGIDVNLLAMGSESDVAARTRQVLEYAAPRGGYVCGSGNSITNYVPPGNYLAMIEAVHRFNGPA